MMLRVDDALIVLSASRHVLRWMMHIVTGGGFGGVGGGVGGAIFVRC